MRLIDADNLKIPNDAPYKASVKRVVSMQPTVEAKEVVHGKWVADECGIYFCSTCDSEAYWDTDYGQQLFNHCPYCGADMRERK